MMNNDKLFLLFTPEELKRQFYEIGRKMASEENGRTVFMTVAKSPPNKGFEFQAHDKVNAMIVGTSLAPIRERGKSDVLRHLMTSIAAQHKLEKEWLDNVERMQITHAYIDECPTIEPCPEPKPKNKPWYGKFNKGKY